MIKSEGKVNKFTNGFNLTHEGKREKSRMTPKLGSRPLKERRCHLLSWEKLWEEQVGAVLVQGLRSTSLDLLSLRCLVSHPSRNVKWTHEREMKGRIFY